MEKQLTRNDYLLALTFLFMLTCVIAAFFIGMKIGESQTEAKYSGMAGVENLIADSQAEYKHQHLVSFYHTIYVPFTDFEKKWLELKNGIELQTATGVPAAFQQLSGLAEKTYREISPLRFPDSSPKLVESHRNYMKSLELFAQSLDRIRGQARTGDGQPPIAVIERDELLKEAERYALMAQQNFYEAIRLWHQEANPGQAETGFSPGHPLTPQQWNQMSLASKNAYVAGLMLEKHIFAPYTPQDLTARIDEFIEIGRANRLELDDIGQIADLIADTESVRPGDFLKNKMKRYAGETLPSLPFFSS